MEHAGLICGTDMSDSDAEAAEWAREWGQVTPLPRGGLVRPFARMRARSEDVTRCDRPEIRIVVEISLDDIADAPLE